MHRRLLEILVDPIAKTPLQLEVAEESTDNEILTGSLRSSRGDTYAITNGIPRFVLTDDQGQKQTEKSFGYKWQQRDTYDSDQVQAAGQKWLVKRYGFGGVEEMRDFFSGRKRILDAGCGGGYSAALWMNKSWSKAEWVGADISAAIDVAQDRLGRATSKHFVQADVLQLPFCEASFDTVFSEGVLHHTPSTERALKSAVSVLQEGGEAMFYVYCKKGPIREFTDDYIRGLVAPLDPQDAWEKLRPLTRLAQSLAELHQEIEVPEDIPYLGIKAGRYDVQRLLYWNFAKMFWNESLSFEENHHINFDWYHPRYSHRQTEEEVRRWCDEAKLSITHFDVEESGFTVRAIKG